MSLFDTGKNAKLEIAQNETSWNGSEWKIIFIEDIETLNARF